VGCVMYPVKRLCTGEKGESDLAVLFGDDDGGRRLQRFLSPLHCYKSVSCVFQPTAVE